MENNMNLNNANQKDEIDIKKILLIIWQGKFLIVTLTILFSFTALFYSLSLQNIYQSNAVLSSTELTNSNNQSSSLGGLASIAGINIQSGSQGKTALAIEKIKTLSFFEDNILPNIYLPDLMALKSWDVKSNTHLYNEDIYDSEKNLWISMPSPQKSYRSFRSILTVKENRDGSLITISIKHNSPYIAQAWTELIVDQINNYYRSIDEQEAIKSIDFLNVQMAQTTYTELKQAISQLIKQKMQKLTLIEANEFYVFSYLDPPQVMETKIEPDRISILILGAVLGGMLGIIVTLIRNFFGFKELE
jgi:uncharacterized protein involved in exopolysaccharide biosynthesis